jgi:hypothetical protein
MLNSRACGFAKGGADGTYHREPVWQPSMHVVLPLNCKRRKRASATIRRGSCSRLYAAVFRHNIALA